MSTEVVLGPLKPQALTEPLSPSARPGSQDAAAIARRRNENIDVIRLIAAVSIVYVHAVRSPALDASRNLFRFAVPFYLFASFYFQSLSLRKRTDRTLGQYIAGRFKRLYVPYLAWSVIYLVARDIRRKVTLHIGPARLEPGLLWRGVEYHLWFLPYLLAGSIFLAVVHWMTLRQDRRWRWPLIIAATAAGFAFAYAHMPANWDQTFDNPTYAYVQFWRAMPTMCWALGFAWLMTAGPVVYSVSSSLGLVGVVLAVLCSVKQMLQGIELIPRALSGLGCMLAALAPWNTVIVPSLAKIGRLSYGIYLCHVLISEFVRNAAFHFHLPDSVQVDMVVFVCTLLGSISVVLGLARSPKTAWLNG
jgi:peptidoglycan/LPS O-acetylase OafA/YrhL